MYRRDLIPLLMDRTVTLSDLARSAGEKPKDILDALQHLIKSSKHADYVIVVDPAECRKCGFEFGTDKLSRPGKCPKCKGTWIFEPRFSVHQRTGDV